MNNNLITGEYTRGSMVIDWYAVKKDSKGNDVHRNIFLVDLIDQKLFEALFEDCFYGKQFLEK